MTETPLRPITNSGTWIPMLAPTHSTMISSDEPRCRGFNQSRIQIPLSFGMLLARDSIVGIIYLVQSRYRQVSLLVPVIHHPVANSLVTELIMMMSYRVGPEIPLRHTE